MKIKMIRKISCCFLIASMTLTVPAYAMGETRGNDEKESPAAEYFREEYINPEYEEWKNTGKKGSPPPLQDMSYLNESYAEFPSTYGSLPESYDLRDYGLVEPVYDQGNYQNCWAVAANVVAGSPLLSQFPQLSLSPYHTTWFTYRGNEEEEAEYCDDPFEYGGFSTSAVNTFAAWKGPVLMSSLSEDPYTDGNPPEETRFNAEYHMQDSCYMPSGSFDEGDYFGGNREITKRIIMETGPVSVKFKSDDLCFNSETNAWYNGKHDYSDHQVVIAGWDDNYPKENFLEEERPSSDGAWLVRNSWGTDWGEDGYFWLSYEDKTIGISSGMVLEENDNYKKNYQYDTLGWVYSIVPDKKGGETKSGTAANIFKAESNELLEAVSFYTTDAGAEYTVSVYGNVKKNKPESGKLLTTQDGAEAFAGYHTIELDEPVKVEKGKNFSIVVSFANTEFPCAVPVEMTWYAGQPPEYMGNGGESYILSDGSWKDVAGTMDDYYITNVCIKGFTNPLPESGGTAGEVRTSEKAGPVRDGTEIELTSFGSDEIYYSLGGTDYKLYTEPVRLSLPEKDDSVTLRAYGIKDGKKGNLTEKTYTRAYAQLTDLAASNGWDYTHCDTETGGIKNIFFEDYEDEITIMGQSCDEIYVDGKKLDSSEWTEPVKLNSGEERIFNVTVKGEGKEDTEYMLHVFKDIVSIDYMKETIHFDDKKYTLTDPDGKQLKSGDSVSVYADSEYDTFLTLKTDTGGETEILISPRERIYDIPIDYENETTFYFYEPFFRYSENPDMSNSVKCRNDKVKLTPGRDLYFRVDATEYSFASNVYHLVVPERPDKPEITIDKKGSDFIKLKKQKGVLYSADGKNWSGKALFEGMKPGYPYRIYAFKKATDSSFSSDISSSKITTLKAAVPAGSESEKTPGTGDVNKIHLWILLLATVLLFVIILSILDSDGKNK